MANESKAAVAASLLVGGQGEVAAGEECSGVLRVRVDPLIAKDAMHRARSVADKSELQEEADRCESGASEELCRERELARCVQVVLGSQ